MQMKSAFSILLACGCLFISSGCGPSKVEIAKAIETDRIIAPKKEEQELKAVFYAAPAKRASVDAALSQGTPSTRVDFKGETKKLNIILSKLGFDSPTITEGVREDLDEGFLYKLEVMMETDYYVVLKTNAEITEGTLISKTQGSPWSK